jgi:hypothetical protein
MLLYHKLRSCSHLFSAISCLRPGGRNIFRRVSGGEKASGIGPYLSLTIVKDILYTLNNLNWFPKEKFLRGYGICKGKIMQRENTKYTTYTIFRTIHFQDGPGAIFRKVQFSSPLFSEGEGFFLTCWAFFFASIYVGGCY